MHNKALKFNPNFAKAKEKLKELKEKKKLKKVKI